MSTGLIVLLFTGVANIFWKDQQNILWVFILAKLIPFLFSYLVHFIIYKTLYKRVNKAAVLTNVTAKQEKKLKKCMEENEKLDEEIIKLKEEQEKKVVKMQEKIDANDMTHKAKIKEYDEKMHDAQTRIDFMKELNKSK